MNEIDIMKRAKMYLDKLSQGINPLDGTKTNPDDITNNERISRCFQYVSTVLEDVINTKDNYSKNIKATKSEFTISDDRLAAFEYSDTPIPLSEILRRINSLIDNEKIKKLKNTSVSEYLIEIGILKIQELTNGSKHKIPTALGYSIGISVESRTSPNGTHYTVNLYSKNAQQFIIDNIGGAIEKNNAKK